MNSGSLDSSHYISGKIPVGNWRSVDELDRENWSMAVSIPPKRSTLDSFIGEVPATTGLRIGINPPCRAACDTGHRLEVQEFNGPVVRLEPEAALAPKVERHTTFHERATCEKGLKNPMGEGQNWGVAQLSSMRWLAGVGAGIIALVTLVMILLPSINAPNAPRTRAANKILEVENVTTVDGSDTLNQLLTKQSEAMQMFRAYSQAVLIDKIVPLIRNGEALRETLRCYWHPLEIPTTWVPAAESTWTVFEAAGHACGLLQGVFPDGSKFTAYFTNDNNQLLLDWKATSSFGTASFEQLNKNEGDASEIRGQISIADFYSSAWTEAEYQSYRLVSPDEKNAIWCYARRGSSAENIVTSLFQGGEIVQEAQDTRNITLQLERGSSAALLNQWLIGQVLQVDSITP